jgi:hypothetical protein
VADFLKNSLRFYSFCAKPRESSRIIFNYLAILAEIRVDSRAKKLIALLIGSPG